MLWTGGLPDKLVRALSAWFKVTWKDGGPLLSKIRSGRGLHALIRHLASRVDPIPGLNHPTLLGVNPDGTVHILHLFFFVPVVPYSTNTQLIAFSEELPPEVLPWVKDLPVDAFVVWRSVCNIHMDYHRLYLEGVPPSSCQVIP